MPNGGLRFDIDLFLLSFFKNRFNLLLNVLNYWTGPGRISSPSDCKSVGFIHLPSRFKHLYCKSCIQSGEQVLVLVNFRIYARRRSDLYCPIRRNYELAQKNERECFQVLNMASLARRNLQAIRLLGHALAVSARSLAVGDSEIYALLLNNG